MADNSLLPNMRWVYFYHNQLLEEVLGYGSDEEAFARAQALVVKFNKECETRITEDDRKEGEFSKIPFAKISKSPDGEQWWLWSIIS